MANLILALYLTNFAHADALESRYLQLLTHIHSTVESENIHEEYERTRIVHTACEIQLREHAAPLACYEALAFEHPSHLQEQIEKLDLLCSEASRKLRIQDEKPGPHVSDRCVKNLTAAARIRAYREEGTVIWSEN